MSKRQANQHMQKTIAWIDMNGTDAFYLTFKMSM